MIPTAARLSKASRVSLTPKRGNKDFYKGTRQAFLPGGRRTGAPGKHVVRGKAKYRLLDEKVRVYVAPPIQDIESSPLKPYVALGTRLSKSEESALFGHFTGPMGLTPQHFLRVAREYTYALQNPESPYKDSQDPPDWMAARIRLGIMPSSQTGLALKEEQPVTAPGAKESREGATRHQKPLRELEVVE
jgi:large subunit ribosomal protein L41